MGLNFVTNDESYYAHRGVNSTKILWEDNSVIAEGSTARASKIISTSTSCSGSSVSSAADSSAEGWGLKAHPELANHFYIYSRTRTSCIRVWLSASATCTTTAITLADQPSENSLWEIEPKAQADWDNDAYTFAGTYSIRSFIRDQNDCAETLIALTDTNTVALYDDRAQSDAANLATDLNSQWKLSSINHLLFMQ